MDPRPKTKDPILTAAQFILNHTEGSEGAMAIQALVVIVGMDDEGGKWISHFRSEDLRTWEAKGMAADLQDTLSAVEVIRQMEDDDII